MQLSGFPTGAENMGGDKIEFYSTGLFTKFLNKTRQFLITNGIKGNQEFSNNLLTKSVGTSNLMFGRAVWDKFPKCIFENFEIARVKRGQFQKFRKSQG